MFEELVSLVKTELIDQYVRRLLDYNLGIYKLEEGEILEHWDSNELDKTAKQIASERLNKPCANKPCASASVSASVNENQIYLYYGYEEEPIEIVIV